MKRAVACVLTAMLLLGMGTVMAESVGRSALPPLEIEPVVDTIGLQRGTELIVGSTTALSGCFATNLWSHNTADIDVRALLHGYSTISWSDVYSYGFMLDRTVVQDLREEDLADGSRVYTIVLSEGLTYNDGSPITAKDYLFSLLLTGSKEVIELGGTPESLSYIAGYDEYRMGQRSEVSGLRLVSDRAFSIQIKPEYLEYFYLLALLNVTPYPISVIAPGCDVTDGGAGAYIAASETAAAMAGQDLPYTPGQFDARMLAETMLNPETGYVYNPRVTSGPYSLVSFDAEAREARFVVNERYVGNFEKQKPHIERLVYRQVTNATMVSDLAEGRVHLLNKVTSGTTLNEAFALSGAQGAAQYGNYPRTGFAFLAFACEQDLMSSANVRKAIAHCVDQEAYIDSVVGRYSALPVHGYYGIGQWMVTSTFDADSEAGLEALDTSAALDALAVPYDLEAAKALLIADGWTLNDWGEPYVDGDGIRHREVDGELVPLTIRWAKTANNPIADGTQRILTAPFEIVGIGLDVTEMSFEEMLTHYYRQVDREYDMFFLGNNFMFVFDPYNDFSTADEYQGTTNTTGLRDPQMMALADDLRKTYPTDTRGYVEKWLTFQSHWAEMMPMVPLYSNVYFDFYGNDLQAYDIAVHTTWSDAILYAWIGEAPAEADPFAEGGFGDDAIEADDGEIEIIE